MGERRRGQRQYASAMGINEEQLQEVFKLKQPSSTAGPNSVDSPFTFHSSPGKTRAVSLTLVEHPSHVFLESVQIDWLLVSSPNKCSFFFTK